MTNMGPDGFEPSPVCRRRPNLGARPSAVHSDGASRRAPQTARNRRSATTNGPRTAPSGRARFPRLTARVFALLEHDVRARLATGARAA